MNKVTIFKYEENKLVRTMSINDEPWFVLKDVCDVLGLSNSRMVSDRLDDDEKGGQSDLHPWRFADDEHYQRVRPV